MTSRDDRDDAVRVPGWEAFAAGDRALRAPPRVGDAVMRAWTARAGRPASRTAPARPGWAAAAAAACVAGVLGGALQLTQTPHQPSVAGSTGRAARVAAAAPAGPAGPAVPVVAVVPNLPASPRMRNRMSAAYRAVTGRSEVPLVTLAADPPLDGESLQIVRMRVPRAALQAFGVAVGDPSLSEVVEVDVVVGGDGLPRDIRRVRPVIEAGEP